MNNTNTYFVSNDLAKAGAPIWERLFLTHLNYKDTLTEDHLRKFGVFAVGDETIDADTYNHVTARYLTINDLVEYHKRGVNLSIVNHAETKDIYDIVSAYLLSWKLHLENGINIGGAPLDDLVHLDRFATAVYDHAVEHITTDFIDSNMLKYIGNRKIGRAAFEKPVEIKDDTQVKKHNSLSTLFSERVFSARSWK